MKLLFVTSTQKLCGIYQYGHRVYKHLSATDKWETHYTEVGSLQNFLEAYETVNPDIVLYSCNQTTVPAVYDFDVKQLPGKHIGVCHEPEQCMLEGIGLDRDWFNGPAFQYWVGFDPTLNIPEDNHRCFKATRPITRTPYTPPPEIPTFGCQCFGFHHRGHRHVIQGIVNEYDRAIVRFKMPPSTFGDPHLGQARSVAQECAHIARQKPGIEFIASHEFFDSEEETIAWVAQNTANLYFYDPWAVPSHMRGVASSPDLSIAARRPAIVNVCWMFRHLHPVFGAFPRDGSLHQLLSRAQETKGAEFLYNEWTPERMRDDFARMFEAVL